MCQWRNVVDCWRSRSRRVCVAETARDCQFQRRRNCSIPVGQWVKACIVVDHLHEYLTGALDASDSFAQPSAKHWSNSNKPNWLTALCCLSTSFLILAGRPRDVNTITAKFIKHRSCVIYITPQFIRVSNYVTNRDNFGTRGDEYRERSPIPTLCTNTALIPHRSTERYCNPCVIC